MASYDWLSNQTVQSSQAAVEWALALGIAIG